MDGGGGDKPVKKIGNEGNCGRVCLFYTEADLGGSGHCQIVTSLDQDVMVDVLTAKSCQNSNCTFRMIIKSSSPFDRINKDDLNYSYWQIVSLACLPSEKPRDSVFYPRQS